MIAEQERTESKRRQRQGIEVAKKKGIYKWRPSSYSENAKEPQKRSIYRQIVKGLNEGRAIAKIAREQGVHAKKSIESNVE